MFIVDFDDTLFDTYRWKQERLFRPLEKLGIPPEATQEAYREVRDTWNIAYTHEAHAEALARRGFPKAEVIATLVKSIDDGIGEFLFDDARSFLESLRNMHQPLILLTLGDPVFQRMKVTASGILDLFDTTYFVNRHKERALDPILTLCRIDEPMWFINDVLEETGVVKNTCSAIRPIMRVSKAYNRDEYVKSGFPFFDTLTEIAQYVERNI